MGKLEKYLLLLLIPLSFFSCEREFVFLSGSDGLNFSVDTLMFDTIFTSVGSATKNFRIYNPYDEDIIINSVELSGGETSSFRLNINGQAEERVENLKINAKDSLYIFVDITIEPDDTTNPFVVNDSVIFHSGERFQKVNLVAYGQNVVLLKKTNIKTSTFTAEKPYLIYDFLVVDSAETLTIDPGARLHFHNEASLIVFGSMQVKGTTEEPVSFLGDRLEDWYQDKPGQWGYIHFMPGSSNNVIDNAIIKNGLMGIFVDSVGIGSNPPLTISNTTINHVSQFGILTQNSEVDVYNSIIGDCGYHSVALTLGGTYNFYHTTIANYFPSYVKSRNTPALFLNNYYKDDEGEETINPLIEANFYNSIVHGDRYMELGFDFKESEKYANKGYSYQFVNCLLKSGDMDLSDEDKFVSVWANEDPNFIDPLKFNYQLDTLSFCKDIGDLEIGSLFPKDILNQSRIDDKGPDLGAYERIEKE
ncbi:right-handed parallel beta-helix repeat-containing protein [Labilibacter marinus]|uniref:right-handed parallel beta-helix repeat-containing protein n=1 Tax=Labilibacter marinus TaxID=1477105 RepID=UPI0009502783|nr:right-handed parallel beta-helix repeat-containing protein [Labilibacter marinus]